MAVWSVGKLVRRQQVNGRHLLQRALAVDVEQAQAVDFIVKEIEAVGLIAAHREQVEQRARVAYSPCSIT